MAWQEEVNHLAVLFVREKLRKIKGWKPVKQYISIYNDIKKDLGYIKPTKPGVIIPPELPQGTMFDITNMMIQIFNLNRVFVGMPTNDGNMHAYY